MCFYVLHRFQNQFDILFSIFYCNYLFAYVVYTELDKKWLYNYVLELAGLVITAHPRSSMALGNGSIIFFSLDSNQEEAFLPQEEEIESFSLPKSRDNSWQREHTWRQMAQTRETSPEPMDICHFWITILHF